MKFIYYITKTEIRVNPKNWGLTGKYQCKITFSPKTWNHPTVVPVILGLAVCQKHVLKAQFLQKLYFVEIICSLHFCFWHKRGPYQSSGRQTTAVVHGIPVRIQWDWSRIEIPIKMKSFCCPYIFPYILARCFLIISLTCRSIKNK